MTMKKIAISILLCLAGCSSPCPEYCGTSPAFESMADRCAVAFGEQYSVPRQCGHVPAGCMNLSEFSPGFVSPCEDGSTEDVLCCKR